jgi:thiol peroxidase
MATITLKGQEIHTSGELPAVGSKAPDFVLTGSTLGEHGLSEWAGKRKLLNIFPSIDTPVCAMSTRRFGDYARARDDTVMLMISADLPFAHQRFCGAEDVGSIVTLSCFRAPDFPVTYGVRIEDGPLRGLCARAVVVIDESDTVRYTQLVPEIAQEPDYEAALRALD